MPRKNKFNRGTRFVWHTRMQSSHIRLIESTSGRLFTYFFTLSNLRL